MFLLRGFVRFVSTLLVMSQMQKYPTLSIVGIIECTSPIFGNIKTNPFGIEGVDGHVLIDQGYRTLRYAFRYADLVSNHEDRPGVCSVTGCF